MKLDKEEFKHIMQPIVKFGLTKAGIISTLHIAVRYGPQYLGSIGIFYLFLIQGAGQISFLFDHYWQLTTYNPLFWTNLSNIQF